MSAAAVLDPLNWCKNGVGKYHVPVQKYSETMQSELTAVVSAFESDEGSGESELVVLECYMFNKKYNKKLGALTERTSQAVPGRKGTRTLVCDHKQRLGFFQNILSAKLPVCAKAYEVLLSMPVTACAADRNWSKWGQIFVPKRNNLGREVAEKIIYVQLNDPCTRIPRGIEGMDTLVQ